MTDVAVSIAVACEVPHTINACVSGKMPIFRMQALTEGESHAALQHFLRAVDCSTLSPNILAAAVRESAGDL